MVLPALSQLSGPAQIGGQMASIRRPLPFGDGGLGSTRRNAAGIESMARAAGLGGLAGSRGADAAGRLARPRFSMIDKVDAGPGQRFGRITAQLQMQMPELFGPLDATPGADPWGQMAAQGAQVLPNMKRGIAAPGGRWARLDTYNVAISDAVAKVASETGVAVDPNVVKAMMAIESGFGSNTALVQTPEGPVWALVGMKPAAAASWGLDPNRLSSPNYQIYAMATVLANGYRRHGAQYGWDGVIRWYFSGKPYNDPGHQDSLGTAQPAYLNTVKTYLSELGSYAAGPQPQGQSGTGYSGGGNFVVEQAMQYQGVPYAWGGIPGANQNPWDTGWDCSGFTWFLDQKYGSGTMPQGSHHQYQWGLQNGKIFTSPQQLQPGDVIFFDTGFRGGSGANLNGASHTGIYVGNGQFMHAASAGKGTIISDLNTYMGLYPYLGGMHMSWSGGTDSGSFGASPAGNTYGGDPRYGGTAAFLQSWMGGWRPS